MTNCSPRHPCQRIVVERIVRRVAQPMGCYLTHRLRSTPRLSTIHCTCERDFLHPILHVSTVVAAEVVFDWRTRDSKYAEIGTQYISQQQRPFLQFLRSLQIGRFRNIASSNVDSEFGLLTKLIGVDVEEGPSQGHPALRPFVSHLMR